MSSKEREVHGRWMSFKYGTIPSPLSYKGQTMKIINQIYERLWKTIKSINQRCQRLSIKDNKYFQSKVARLSIKDTKDYQSKTIKTINQRQDYQ